MSNLNSYILFIGVSTLIIAGLSAINEIDIKKVVALSTLSQLGLIISALGVGAPEVRFFHLNTHAFIKALLFVAMGCIIHNSNDYQDLRKSRLMHFTTPISRLFMVVANVALRGFPFIAGFYSKDMWLELSTSRIKIGLFTYALFYLRIALTVIYRTRLILYIRVFHLRKRSSLSKVTDDRVQPKLAITGL